MQLRCESRGRRAQSDNEAYKHLLQTIFEFYAATEGSVGLWNRSRNSFGTGAIGRYGLLSGAFLGLRTAVVRLDDEMELPWRDPATGFCQRVKPGGVGELIASLPADDVNKRFQGYYGNAAATNSKIMRDVFRKGDAWCVPCFFLPLPIRPPPSIKTT